MMSLKADLVGRQTQCIKVFKPILADNFNNTKIMKTERSNLYSAHVLTNMIYRIKPGPYCSKTPEQ